MIAAAAGMLATSAVDADTFVVSNNNDSGPGSLRAAIETFNATAPGIHDIVVQSGVGNINLGSPLPTLSAGGQVTIQGNGVTVDGQSAHRIFYVESGFLHLEDLTLQNGHASGGDGGDGSGGGGGGMGAGGAIFTEFGGSATIRGVRFINNTADGGDGGDANTAIAGGGGGGGLDNDGADGTATAGGAGGARTASGGGIPDGAGGDGGFGGGAAGDAEEYAGGGGGGPTDALGGTSAPVFGDPVHGGGDGGRDGDGGDGGDGGGGAIFGNIWLHMDADTSFSGSAVTAGVGGTGDGGSDGADGTAYAEDIFLTSASFFDVNSGSHTLSANVGGSGQIVKVGTGELVLSGAITTPDRTHVSGGRLSVNGTMTGGAEVIWSGELGGTGTITGDVVLGDFDQIHTGGRLAAGNSIGTLNIVGDLGLGGGSVVEVEVDRDNAVDLTNVDGNITINPGSTVEVVGPDVRYDTVNEHTFLTATGTLTGTFDSVSDNLVFYDASLGYTANSAFVMIERNDVMFTDFSRGDNATFVGDIFDHLGTPTDPDVIAFQNELLLVDADRVRTTLLQAGSSHFASTGSAQVQGSVGVINRLSDQIRAGVNLGVDTVIAPTAGPAGLVAAPSGGAGGSASGVRTVSHVAAVGGGPLGYPAAGTPPAVLPITRSLWAFGYGLGGRAEGGEDTADIDYGSGGFLIGGDRAVSEGSRWGAFFGLGWGSSSTDLGSSSDIENYQFGITYGYTNQGNYLIFVGGLSLDDIESSRRVDLATTSVTASADQSATQIFTGTEIGRYWVFGSDYLFQPFLGLRSVNVFNDGFTETGGGVLNLAVEDYETHSLRGSIGGRLTHFGGHVGKLFVRPDIHGSYQGEFLDTEDDVINASFVNLNGARFVNRGLDIGDEWFNGGGGLSLYAGRHLQMRGDYLVSANEHQVTHVGSGQLIVRW